MTADEFEDHLLNCLASYWRIRAALALLRQTRRADFDLRILSYRNCSDFSGKLLTSETVTDALNQLNSYETERLTNDWFLALVARAEMFLAAKIWAAGEEPCGTFGKLQHRAEELYGISGVFVNKLGEIRERRNSLIHDRGTAKLRYINAARVVAPVSNGHVSVPSEGDLVVPNPEYLSYCVESMFGYAKEYTAGFRAPA